MEFDIGQACTKTAGKEKGNNCVVVDKVDDNFVVVLGPKVKKRRCNVRHLQTLSTKFSISKGIKDEELFDIMYKSSLAQPPNTPVKKITVSSKTKKK